jgi:hypothetical protein
MLLSSQLFTTMSIESGIAIGAHYAQILDAIVVVDPIDVVQYERHVSAHPLFALTAYLALALLEASLVEA